MCLLNFVSVYIQQIIILKLTQIPLVCRGPLQKNALLKSGFQVLVSLSSEYCELVKLDWLIK